MPPARFHTRAIPSVPPVTTRFAAGSKAAEVSGAPCVKDWRSLPSSAPHTRATPSTPAVTRSEPSRENATSTAAAGCGITLSVRPSRRETRSMPSSPTLAIVPSGATATPRPAAVCRPTTDMIGSTAGFHTRAEPSSLAVTTLPPSGVNTASRTSPEWPSSAAEREKSSTPQMRADPSSEAVTTDVPSGLNPTPTTWFECSPRNVTSAPVWVLKILPPLSVLAVASRLPFGDHATSRTFPRCGNWCNGVPAPASQIIAKLSRPPVATRSPAGENAAVTMFPGWSSKSGGRPQLRTSKTRASRATVSSWPPVTLKETRSTEKGCGSRAT